MSANIPAKPPDIDKLDSLSAVQPNSPEENTPEQGKFSRLMENEPNQVNKTPSQSPMDVANQGRASASTPPTLASIQAQMNSVSGTLGDVKSQLHTKGLKLKQSEKYLLRNKLSSMSDNLRGVAANTGANPGPPVDLLSKKNPIAKFLELVTDGQNQMSQASQEIHNLTSNGGQLNAGTLLLVQAKLQKAQQELDYTSILLGKATDMIKTLFNIQI